jgi:hypothetical protein
MGNKCIGCAEFVSAFSFVPIYLFQTVFKCLLVPYLRVTLNASDWQIVLVLSSGFIPKLVVEQIIGCNVLSRYKRNIYAIYVMNLALLLLWIASSLVLAFLPMIMESLGESNSSMLTIGMAALCHGVMSCASSIYSGLLPFFVPKSSWDSWLVFFSMVFLGTGAAIGILWIPVDPLANMYLIIVFATTAALIFFVLSQVGHCLSIKGEKVNYTRERRTDKPASCEKCYNFGTGLSNGFGNGMWTMWLFTLIFGISFGSFMYFATEWYVINGTVSEAGTTILNSTIIDSYTISSAFPNFSYLSAVQILGNVGFLWLAMGCVQAFCKKRGSNQNRAMLMLWFWMIFGSAFSIAGFVVLTFAPYQDWIQSIAFALLGLYSVCDLGPLLLYYSSLKRYLFAKTSKTNVLFIKSQFLMFLPVQLFGQAIGVALMPIGINYFGYMEFFRISSLIAAFGWCILLWIPFSFLFELISPKGSRTTYQNLPTTPRKQGHDDDSRYSSKPRILLKSVKSV